MSETIQYRLLIKQVIGRLLLDTVKAGLSFTLDEHKEGWRIRVEGVPLEKGQEIIALVDDLNLFYFEENPSDPSAVRKWWLYGKQQPRHSYDEAGQTLELIVDSRVGYSNQSV
ncbi:hypothetical protein [Paenibacillus sp. SYP-B4298]|uniref:hypothetical protein n=1 Tax=Paenibacillus sp. SYP-B4298 TaxID=2996034 RepID=UPI0022DDAC4F|nr:hypothetical protein [Paenibacillus sp. SYP-B4298]